MFDQPTLVTQNNDATVLRDLGKSTKPCLVLYSGDDAGQRFDLEPGPQIIGRLPEAQVRIDGPGVSRQHAELLVGAGLVVIKDLGSANGTHVNEIRITEPTALKDGDLVRVSGTVLRFHAHNSLDLVLQERIHRQATTDTGTGAHNRKFMTDVLRQAFARARRNGSPLSVICYDLDHFKQVNDRFGHAVGDHVLQSFANLVAETLRQTDRVGRYGGEEFAFIFPETTPAEALRLTGRLRQRLADTPPRLPDGSALPVTVSFGLADATGSDLEGSLAQADSALYQAKGSGRDRCVLASPDTRSVPQP